VKVGYRGPAEIRGYHPSGHIEVIVHNLDELARLIPEKDIVRLGARHARAVVTLPVTLRFDEPGVVQRMLRQALRG
jgi:hypothetical protein